GAEPPPRAQQVDHGALARVAEPQVDDDGVLRAARREGHLLLLGVVGCPEPEAGVRCIPGGAGRRPRRPGRAGGRARGTPVPARAGHSRGTPPWSGAAGPPGSGAVTTGPRDRDSGLSALPTASPASEPASARSARPS